MSNVLERIQASPWKYGLGALGVVLIGWYIFAGNSKSQGATLTITPADFSEQVSVSGTVIAAKDVDLGFAANGRISGTYVRVGQHVGAGTILAQIENGDLVAALAQAQANLDSLVAGTRPEEVAVALAAVTSAESTLTNAIQSAYTVSDDAVRNKVDVIFMNPRVDPKLSFSIGNSGLKTVVETDRLATEAMLADWSKRLGPTPPGMAVEIARQSQLNLAKINTLLTDASAAITQGIVDQSTTAATLSSYSTTISTARTNITNALTTLTSAVASLDAAQKNLTLKQAGSTSEAIAAQQAAVASARSALAKTVISAPFSGTVTRMDAKVGAIVSPSSALISLQSDGTFQIETFISEVSIAGVVVGNRATTTLDAYGTSIEFPAVVIAVDPAETMKDGVPTYKTTLGFTKNDPRIRSGMTASVRIETGLLHDAVVIPTGAVGHKNGTSYVSVVTDREVVTRTVTSGTSPSLGQTHILSGLSKGDVILLTPEEAP